MGNEIMVNSVKHVVSLSSDWKTVIIVGLVCGSVIYLAANDKAFNIKMPNGLSINVSSVNKANE